MSAAETATGNAEPAGGPDYSAMRQAMVSSQLRTSAVNDPRVVAAMARVPRERFVPAAARPLAYRDASLPLGADAGGRRLNLPMATGRLLTEAYLRPSDRVLLIGAATGYAAAVLAELVAAVAAVESEPALLAHARSALAGEPRVTVVEGALADGAPDLAPFDVLVVDGAVELVPDTLAAQLRPEGRAVAGLVDRGVTRLAAGRRVGDRLALQAFADAECAELPGFARPRAFAF